MLPDIHELYRRQSAQLQAPGISELTKIILRNPASGVRAGHCHCDQISLKEKIQCESCLFYDESIKSKTKIDKPKSKVQVQHNPKSLGNFWEFLHLRLCLGEQGGQGHHDQRRGHHQRGPELQDLPQPKLSQDAAMGLGLQLDNIFESIFLVRNIHRAKKECDPLIQNNPASLLIKKCYQFISLHTL